MGGAKAEALDSTRWPLAGTIINPAPCVGQGRGAAKTAFPRGETVKVFGTCSRGGAAVERRHHVSPDFCLAVGALSDFMAEILREVVIFRDRPNLQGILSQSLGAWEREEPWLPDQPQGVFGAGQMPMMS
jgi:hypothetical protein